MADNFMNALTVDVEDAVNQGMRNYFNTDLKPTYRVYENTMRLLDLFSEYQANATFFILGEVAEEFPGLIREIANRGHELGIHGFSHTRYNNLSRDNIREEIIRSKQIIEEISGCEVLGHRAPEFSINSDNFWILGILAESGIKYDTSIFPVKAGRYGWPGFKKDIGWIYLEEGNKIIEAPLSAVSFFGRDIPACGGGYLRVSPYAVTKYVFKKILKERPVTVYLHPYEIDTPPFQQFYMNAIREAALETRIQMKMYWFNRKSVLPKLRYLLQDFRFTCMRSVINNVLKVTI